MQFRNGDSKGLGGNFQGLLMNAAELLSIAQSSCRNGYMYCVVVCVYSALKLVTAISIVYADCF